MNTMRPIDRQHYLDLPEVRDFISWLEAKLDSPGVFKHNYYLVKANRNWECGCLYEAYENYWWPYKQYCRIQRKEISGSSFKESFAYMSDLSRQFREAVSANDAKLTTSSALEMLKWGGVLNHNRERILKLGDKSPAHFKKIRESLDLNRATLVSNEQIFVNSGFTKLYFLLVDNFIMYDGRVGAALGLLGRLYAEEKGLNSIPPAIEFSFGSGKTSASGQEEADRRDPSKGRYNLPRFSGRLDRHLNDNIKASWLLKSIADHTTSRFAKLSQEPPLNERLTAIQSALFMIGYDVRSQALKNTIVHNSGLEQREDCPTYPFKTVAKKFPFRVDYDEASEALRFSYPTKENGKCRAPDYFTLNEIERICFYLAKNFDDSPFPLANNVVKLTSYSEKPGLGMAIRSLPGADVLKAQASSYLGPYLAAVGAFKLKESRQTMWHFLVEVEKVISMIKEFHFNGRH
jgi:hypothetical protein